MTHQSSYRGLFINLDRSADRRARMEARLRQFNLQERYCRFPAVDALTLPDNSDLAKSGDLACFQSHYRALSGVAQFGQTIHIMEDDADFVPQLEPTICSLIVNNRLDGFDIVFTDTAVGLNVGQLRKYKRLFDAYQRSFKPELSVLEFNDHYLYGFGSYLVPALAVERVVSVLHDGLAAGKNAIDLFVRHQAQKGRLRLGCIFPFITGCAPDDIRNTTMPGRLQTHTDVIEVASLLNYSFFLGRDFTKIPHSLLQRLRANDDEHQRLIGAVFGFAVCSKDVAAD